MVSREAWQSRALYGQPEFPPRTALLTAAGLDTHSFYDRNPGIRGSGEYVQLAIGALAVLERSQMF